ncbi:MAG: NifU family protein [Actinomycetota bacterium]|nr:NifU family protein [Actinomycetota bacterium]
MGPTEHTRGDPTENGEEAGWEPPDRLRATGDRIETLLEASAAGGGAARARAEELVGCVSDLYGAGLGRVLEILDESGRLDEQLLAALAGDDLVASLLLVHDLHPYDVETRVRQALDTVRPYLGTHGGDVELLGVQDDGVVRLRLLGSCDGCPSSSVTLQLAVEGAVEAAAPEMTRIEVEESQGAAADGQVSGPVISIDSLRSRIDGSGGAGPGTWVAVPELESLAPGELAGFELDDLSVCACRIGNDVFCFRDRCAHCAGSLAGGVVERRLGDPVGTGVLRCPACRSHYDVRRAGAGLDGLEEHLEPLPVLVRDGVTSIAVPSAVAS